MPTNAYSSFGSGPNSNTFALRQSISAADFASAVYLDINSGAGSAGDYCGLYAANSSVANEYKVPTGKTLYLLIAVATPTEALVGYGTAAPIAVRTATAPTGAVYLSGSATDYATSLWQSSSNVMSPFGVYAIPADMYPFLRTNQAAALQVTLGGILF